MKKLLACAAVVLIAAGPGLAWAADTDMLQVYFDDQNTFLKPGKSSPGISFGLPGASPFGGSSMGGGGSISYGPMGDLGSGGSRGPQANSAADAGATSPPRLVIPPLDPKMLEQAMGFAQAMGDMPLENMQHFSIPQEIAAELLGQLLEKWRQPGGAIDTLEMQYRLAGMLAASMLRNAVAQQERPAAKDQTDHRAAGAR